MKCCCNHPCGATMNNSAMHLIAAAMTGLYTLKFMARNGATVRTGCDKVQRLALNKAEMYCKSQQQP